jgi:hypothetical protein
VSGVHSFDFFSFLFSFLFLFFFRGSGSKAAKEKLTKRENEVERKLLHGKKGVEKEGREA